MTTQNYRRLIDASTRGDLSATQELLIEARRRNDTRHEIMALSLALPHPARWEEILQRLSTVDARHDLEAWLPDVESWLSGWPDRLRSNIYIHTHSPQHAQALRSLVRTFEGSLYEFVGVDRADAGPWPALRTLTLSLVEDEPPNDEINRNHITRIDTLIECLRSCSKLVHFAFDHRRSTHDIPMRADQLTRLLSVLPGASMRTLDLRSIELGDEQVHALATASHLTGLERLRLEGGRDYHDGSGHMDYYDEGNTLTCQGVQALCEIPHLASLRVLELPIAYIGEAGGRAIAASPSLRGRREFSCYAQRTNAVSELGEGDTLVGLLSGEHLALTRLELDRNIEVETVLALLSDVRVRTLEEFRSKGIFRYDSVLWSAFKDRFEDDVLAACIHFARANGTRVAWYRDGHPLKARILETSCARWLEITRSTGRAARQGAWGGCNELQQHTHKMLADKPLLEPRAEVA